MQVNAKLSSPRFLELLSQRGCFVAALLVCIAMVGFAVAISRSACGSCATAIPPNLILCGAVTWALIAALLFRSRALYSALLMTCTTSIHASFLLLLGEAVCPYCVVLFAVQVAILIASLIPAFKEPFRFRARWSKPLLMVVASLGGILVGATINATVLRPGPNQIAREGRPGASTTTAYIIVRRDCKACQDAERKLLEVMESNLPESRVEVIEERSELGSRLKRELGLDTFPAFVGMRHGAVIHAQSGGGVERFINALKQ